MYLYGKRIISVASIIVMSFLLFLVPHCAYGTNEPYTYIYTKGDISDDIPLWEAYKIPEETLSNMSTAALVETLCNFPCWQFMEVMDSGLNSSLDSFIPNYDVVQELCERSDKAEYAEAALRDIDESALLLGSGKIAISKALRFVLGNN